MTSASDIRNKVIDQLLAIKDSDWLPWDISAYFIKSLMMPLSLLHFGTTGKTPKNFSNF